MISHKIMYTLYTASYIIYNYMYIESLALYATYSCFHVYLVYACTSYTRVRITYMYM